MGSASLLALLLGLLLISPTSSSGQSTSSDSQTLQALLQEVRQLRQDVRTVTVATERSQILLSRLQTQQTAVEDAQKEFDQAHTSAVQAEERSKTLQNEIKSYADQDNEEQTPNATDRQKIEDAISRLKTRLDQTGSAAQEAQTSEMQAQEKLQIEQSKMSALQDELDQVDKILQNLASEPIH
jgi:chromosome segregation ATPase